MQENLNEIAKNKAKVLSDKKIEDCFNIQVENNLINEFKDKLITFVDIQIHLKLPNLDNEIKRIKDKFIEQSEKALQSALESLNQPDEKQIINYLMKFQHFKNSPFLSSKQFQQYQQQILEAFKLKSNPQLEQKLVENLQQSRIGKSIIKENEILQNLENTLKSRISIDDTQLGELLKNIYQGKLQTNNLNQQPIAKQDIDYLITQYRNFESEYDKNLKELFESKSHQTIQAWFKTKAETLSNEQFSKPNNLQIPILIALILCIYTYCEKENSKDRPNTLEAFKKYHYQPHPTQIIAIFRLFGIGYSAPIIENNSADSVRGIQLNNKLANPSQIFNNVIDMAPGEDIGIVIAIAASIFAVFSCEVKCACLSKFISQREYEKYKRLFIALGVDNKISYQTLPEICEEYILSSHGLVSSQKEKNLQEAFKLKLEDKKDNQKPELNFVKEEVKTKILLIDNIEILCSLEFYQQLLTPIIRYDNKEASELILKILEGQEKGQQKSFFSSAFNFLKNLFGDSKKNYSKLFNKDFRKLMKQTVYKACFEKNQFEEHKGGNSNDPHSRKNYQKHYEQKNENGKIAYSLILQVGKFHLIQACQSFGLIMGVTTNLSYLDQTQKEILEELKIQNFTIIPSISHEEQKFVKNISNEFSAQIENYYSQQFQSIVLEMKNQKDRPIIVVFETNKNLKQFKVYDKNNNMLAKECQELMSEEFGSVVVESGNFKEFSNLTTRISLITKQDAIGIEYKYNNLEQDFHVIQTFYSQTETEHMSIIGLSSKHGKQGSYSLILNKQETSQITSNLMQPCSNTILRKRQRDFNCQNYLQFKINQEIKKDHENSMEFRKHVFDQYNKIDDKDDKKSQEQDLKLEKFLWKINDLEVIENKEMAQQSIDKNQTEDKRTFIIILIDQYSLSLKTSQIQSFILNEINSTLKFLKKEIKDLCLPTTSDILHIQVQLIQQDGIKISHWMNAEVKKFEFYRKIQSKGDFNDILKEAIKNINDTWKNTYQIFVIGETKINEDLISYNKETNFIPINLICLNNSKNEQAYKTVAKNNQGRFWGFNDVLNAQQIKDVFVPIERMAFLDHLNKIQQWLLKEELIKLRSKYRIDQ